MTDREPVFLFKKQFVSPPLHVMAFRCWITTTGTALADDPRLNRLRVDARLLLAFGCELLYCLSLLYWFVHLAV